MSGILAAREAAGPHIDTLEDLLEEGKHTDDCVYRCWNVHCNLSHSCDSPDHMNPEEIG